MNFLKAFFNRTNPSEEERLSVCLKNYSDALQPIESHWANVLAKFHNEASRAFVEGTPINRKYQLVRELEELFGGMGSLNDINLSKQCRHSHEQLFAAVQGVLRFYWRALGRESHANQTCLFPIGARVRLVPGKTRCFERDESPVVIDNSGSKEQTWQVVRHEGPDITNMASYLVQHEDTFMTARHESLEWVSQ